MHDHFNSQLNNMEIWSFVPAGKALIMRELLEQHANAIDHNKCLGGYS